MRIIDSDQAPAAIGPYSQALEADGFLFLSGQIPIDPKTNQYIETDIGSQTQLVLKNIDAVLKAAGYGPENVVKSTLFLSMHSSLNADPQSDFIEVNRHYSAYFADHKPARSTIWVAMLPKNSRIEIEVTAKK